MTPDDLQIKKDEISTFEAEMRIALAKMSVQQEQLSSDLHEYLSKTVSQEVAMSQADSKIDTLFREYEELKADLRQNRDDISKIIDDKINSLYKMTSITAIMSV